MSVLLRGRVRALLARATLIALHAAFLMPQAALSHTMMMTRILASFDQAGQVSIQLDLDLSLMLGSDQRYYEFATASASAQQAQARSIAEHADDYMQFYASGQKLHLTFVGFTAAQAPKVDFFDGSISKSTIFRFSARLPVAATDVRLVVPIGAAIDYPVAYTMQIPASHATITRWLEPGMHESDPFHVETHAPATVQAHADIVEIPWYSQFFLYLRMGFHHIVPEGTDHILFVLGLFFFGISWRKLISQTSVFTIAHATTLWLATTGTFSLPAHIVEPAIAGSISWIAIENIIKPRLGLTRLAIVFCFGLIHGLGFAGSLSDIPLPRHDFLIALLGFNLGVDFGQLFVIALAFLMIGWWRNRPWFRRRIAIPCSLVIALVGLYWAIERIIFFATH